MVEYFLFYFLYVLSSSNDGDISGIRKHFPLLNSAGDQTKKSSTRKLMNQLGLSTSLPFHWQADASSDVYLSLLREYLCFMVPEIIPQLADPSLAPPENILTTLLLKSSSPVWSRIETGSRYSSFFTGILVEFWMNSYGYAVDESTGTPFSDPDFVLPSVDFLQALQVVSRHYSSVFALSTSSLSTATFIDPAFKTLAQTAFAQIRLSFYRYLRVALSVWPVDGTLNLLIEIWMSLVSPWFHLDPQIAHSSQLPIDDASPNFLVSWRPFLVSSFYLYQTLYNQFFEFSVAALQGFLLSGECEDINEAISRLGALTSCLLEIMNPMLSVSSSLKKRNYFSLYESLSNFLLFVVEIELIKSSSFIRFPSSDAAQINDQLRILEPESFHPRSLFDSNQKLTICKIILMLDQLTLGIFRKCRELALSEDIARNGNNKLIDRSASSASLVDGEDFENDSETRESIFNFILESPKMSVEIKSLAKWSLQVRQDFLTVFQLHADDFKAAKDILKSSNDAKVASPSLRFRGLKAPLPKSQLKYKMSAKPSFNAANDLDGIIRSYEIGFLVPILRTISNLLTETLRSVILENIENKWNVKLPNRIWKFRINLRFFAAYPNIFFIILSLMVLKIVFKIIF